MLLKRPVLFLIFILSFSLNVLFAQSPDLSGNLSEVRIVGSVSNEDLIRVIVNAREGTPVERINLESERNRVLSLGTFQEVTVSIEDRGAGPILLIEVSENPRIGEIEIEGFSIGSEATFTNAIQQANLIEAGRVLSTTRAEEARTTIQQLYRTSAGQPYGVNGGLPFDVPVTLDIVPVSTEPEAAEEAEVDEANDELETIELGDEPVRLTYTITEAIPLEDIVFPESSVLEPGVLEDAFARVDAGKVFNLQAYMEAVQAVDEFYREAGYRGSGVDLERSQLADGVLDLELRELRIASLNTTAIGIDPTDFSLVQGDLYNYDVLLDDVRRLARGRSSDIRIEPLITRSGDVLVNFELGPPESAGPITEIAIEGNTVIATERLLELLQLEVGDTFTSAVANEDFLQIQNLYTEEGYLILAEPNFNFLDGTYVQRISEIKIAGYTVTFEGEAEARTKDFVVTRYLPEPGQVLNTNRLRDGLLSVLRLGVVEPITYQPLPADQPDEAVVNVIVRERQTSQFSPQATYATDTGFSLAADLSFDNFLGRAHRFSTSLSAESTDFGGLFGSVQPSLSVSYSIPWLYVDFLDFKRVPTALSASLFSSVQANQPLSDGDGFKTCYRPPFLPDSAACQEVSTGEYGQRNTGASFRVGRRVFRNTTANFSVQGSYSQYFLETPETICDEDNFTESSCTLPSQEAAQYLPQDGFSGFVSLGLDYDDRDNPNFPTKGVAASTRALLGFGNDYAVEGAETALGESVSEQKSYTYQQFEIGAKTYLQLSRLVSGVTDPKHVFAFKVNAGHQFGGAYPSTKYFAVGDVPSETTQLRGFTRDDFYRTKTYAIGSFEYRYDFGFSTAATQTIVGIVFADIGWMSNVPGFDPYAAPLFAGAGLGIQLNIGFGGFALPPLRFDYGFSERRPGGKFSFRLGPVF